MDDIVNDEILQGTAFFEPSTLLAELKKTAEEPQPTARPDKLPLASIRQVPEVFQPRGISERHVSELAGIIKANGEVDPVTVMQVGPDAVLIDGHHRVAAYEMAGKTNAVPVRWFEGTLEEAVLEAGRANSKAKLPMSTQERQDYAWRLVLMDGYSKAKIASAAGVAKSQVANMRTAMKKLGDAAVDHRSWWRAREAAQGKDGSMQTMTNDEREAWLEEKANLYADRLSKAFGTKLSNNPEVAAMALSIYFGRRMGDLMSELRGHLPDADEEELEADF